MAPVWVTLHSGLVAAQTAAQTVIATGEFEAFERAVEQGLSANLCDAIAAVDPTDPNTYVDVAFSWAISRPPRAAPQDSLRFSTDTIEVVAEAGRLLKQDGPLEDESIFGLVESLHRPEGEEIGTVRIKTLVLGRPARVQLHLDPVQYEKAIQAHRAEQPVACTGTLERDGRRWTLRNAGPLTIVDFPEDEPQR